MVLSDVFGKWTFSIQVRLNDIPVGEPDDSFSKEQFEEVLGY